MESSWKCRQERAITTMTPRKEALERYGNHLAWWDHLRQLFRSNLIRWIAPYSAKTYNIRLIDCLFIGPRLSRFVAKIFFP